MLKVADAAEVVIRIGIVRPVTDRLTIRISGGIEFAVFLKHDTQIVVSFGKIGPNRRDPAVAVDRLAQPAALLQGQAEIVKSLHHVGPEVSGFPIVFDGLFQGFPLVIGDSQVEMGFGVVGRQVHRFVKAGDGRCDVSQFQVSVAEVEMQLRNVRVERARLLIAHDRAGIVLVPASSCCRVQTRFRHSPLSGPRCRSPTSFATGASPAKPGVDGKRVLIVSPHGLPMELDRRL